MSSVVISGNTSGSVTLDAPAVAGSTVLTLPATSGTVLTTASGQWITTGSDIYYNTGNVGIGNTTAYNRLDVLASSNNNSVHLANAANTDTGAYLNATGSSELMLSGGASYNSYSAPNFVMNAKATIASGVYFTGDSVRFWVNTGLTAGTTFNQTERMRIDSSGNLLFNSGYGSVATAYGCRAWVNFNGTGTVSIGASGNVSSITDNGVGDYTINFTTAMPDANYSAQGSGIQSGSGNGPIQCIKVGTSLATGSFRAFSTNDAGAAQDISLIMWSVHR
jgi:hypothetical protein